jgi:probable F420-dependent oxidoreductase
MKLGVNVGYWGFGMGPQEQLEVVQEAERLGYDSVWAAEAYGSDAATVLAWLAAGTSTIKLGSAIFQMPGRSAAMTAMTAATIDELSGGRLILGLGVSHRPVVEFWHGQTIDRPAAEMREYVGIVRAILRGEDPPAGEKWRTVFHLAGLAPRPELPIYIAALSPTMLRLAGEIADGVILWLCNPNYIRDVVVPRVREGREKAGLGLDGFSIVAAVPGAVTDDRAAAYDAMRTDLLPYFGLPFYRAMLERSGFAEDIAAFDAAAGVVDVMRAAISDDFLDVLTAVGSDDDVRAGLQRYADAGTDSPCIGPIARTDFEATLRAGAPG